MNSNVILSIGSYGDKVKKLQKRLLELGYKLEFDGEYGTETRSVVRDFQINATYALDGSLLLINGVVDENTWDLLFAYEKYGEASPDISPAKPSGIYSSPLTSAILNTKTLSPLGQRIIKYAQGEVGVKEIGTNSGKRVNEYQDTVGLKGTQAPWCMCFVMWCYMKSCDDLGINIIWERPRAVSITLQRSGHVQGYKAWAKSKGILITTHRLALPSSFFVMVFSGGSGHTGIIIDNDEKRKLFTTIEGNTSPAGVREGDGVYIKQRRYESINSIIQFKEIYKSS